MLPLVASEAHYHIHYYRRYRRSGSDKARFLHPPPSSRQTDVISNSKGPREKGGCSNSRRRMSKSPLLARECGQTIHSRRTTSLFTIAPHYYVEYYARKINMGLERGNSTKTIARIDLGGEVRARERAREKGERGGVTTNIGILHHHCEMKDHSKSQLTCRGYTCT